ncbi:MAG: glycosyltransferase family 39 protein [Chloroflexi bacterium]|nr:glycosyltransferase family 39 protein [Chloroflexota bacterium]
MNLASLRNFRSRAFVEALGILFLAFVLRLFALGTREIWYDDAFSLLLARRDLASIIAGAAADDQPPLYYALLHFWQLIGDSPFIARFLSVIFSMLVVAMTYALARRLLSPRAARNAALLAAFAPFQIYHAQEIRMYALLAFALVTYAYAASALIKKTNAAMGEPKLFFLLACSGAAALYTHNLAILSLLAVDLFFLWRRDFAALKKLIAAQIVSGILFLPWAIQLPGQLAKISRGFWILPPTLVDVLQLLIEFTTNLPLPTLHVPLALFAALTILAFAVFELWRARERGLPAGVSLLIAFAIVPPVLMLAASYLFRPIFIPRGVIFSSIAYYILLGWLASRLRPRIEVPVILAGALLAALALNYQSAYAEFPRSPFRVADAFLRAHAAPGDAIIHDNKLSFFPMYYSDPALAQMFIADPPAATSNTLTRGAMDVLQIFPASLETATEGRTRVWFVIFQRALDEAASENRISGNKAWLDARFKLISLTQFNDLNVYLYER